MAGEVPECQPMGVNCNTVILSLTSAVHSSSISIERVEGADPTTSPYFLGSPGQISIGTHEVYSWTGYITFIFEREVWWGETTDPSLQTSFILMLRKKKKEEKALHKETFHLPEMSLSSKEKDSECHPDLALHQIWPESYALSTPDSYCAWGSQRENA